MSGFGFSPNSGDNPNDPDDLAGKVPLFAELQKLLSGSGGPVNWDLARQLAISALASEHRRVTEADSTAAADALRLGDLWLDDATDLPSGITSTQAWSQVDWVEKTIGTWAAVCDPVASRVVAAMSSALPPELAAQAGPMAPMMAQVGGLMFGAQLGQGLAALAGEVVSATDVGLPLGPPGTAALVSANVTAMAGELGRPVEEVRLFLALREAAHHRLFVHVPWLRQQLIEAIDAYGRGIKIDPEAISAALTDIDPANPESLQNALSGGLFEPQNTEAQTVALKRLETLLALIEGWVDTVVMQSANARMNGAAAMAEAVRRRRATGGPAEQTFATLVGLELRPRRLHEAAAMWFAMTERHGVAARDGLWNHPDLLPTADDLDHPDEFAATHGTMSDSEQSAFDELARLIEGDQKSEPSGAEPSPSPSEATEPSTDESDDPPAAPSGPSH
jgi:putative hydrolase